MQLTTACQLPESRENFNSFRVSSLMEVQQYVLRVTETHMGAVLERIKGCHKNLPLILHSSRFTALHNTSL